MFENCGSCFAAEQLVDIKLGSKGILPLTLLYFIGGIFWLYWPEKEDVNEKN